MKKTLYTLCCMVAIAIMTATTLTSCDSNASDLKMERITGLYAGTVIVGLYTPDLMVEADNEMVGLNEDLALCSDTIKSTIKLDFLNDGHVKIGVDELKDIDFGIPFLDEHNNVREIFSDGYLAQAYNAVREMVAQGQLTDEEFESLLKIRNLAGHFGQSFTNSRYTILCLLSLYSSGAILYGFSSNWQITSFRCTLPPIINLLKPLYKS